jgi:hypothetical protein
MLKRHMLEVLLPMLFVFCISSIGYTKEVIEKQEKIRVIKTPTQSATPVSRPEYIGTIEQDAASMKAKTKQLAQMISSIKGLRREQRSKCLERAVRDADSLLRHIKAFEKKLGDLHISDPESGMIEANKAKIHRHLDEIQEYVSEAISINSQSVAAGDQEPLESAEGAWEPEEVDRISDRTQSFAPGDHEPRELAVEEPDSEEEPDCVEEPDYEDCPSNIDREDCSGFNRCVACCRAACGDIPDAEDSRAYNSYMFCITDCRSYCSANLLSCILQQIDESNTNNIDALTRI